MEDHARPRHGFRQGSGVGEIADHGLGTSNTDRLGILWARGQVP